jgi:hypothetical protein
VDWLNDYDEVITREVGLKARNAVPSFANWTRLRTISHLQVIQRLSERSELAVPVRTDLLRHLLKIYEDIIADQPLQIWTDYSTEKCLSADNVWRQPIMLSYYLTVKEYLDILNTSIAAAEEIEARDFEYSNTISRVNARCFSSLPQGAGYEEQSAQFVMTYATTGLTWMQSGKSSISERNGFVKEAHIRMRSTIGDLQRLPQSSSLRPLPTADAIVYGRAGQSLLDAARSLRVRLESLEQAP